MPKSLPYHEHRIEFLKNPEAAASYIEAILEEKDPEPELIGLALRNVAEAQAEGNLTPEQLKQHYEKLDELLSKPGKEAIYNLGNWLKVLGLKLSITVIENSNDQTQNSANSSEITV